MVTDAEWERQAAGHERGHGSVGRQRDAVRCDGIHAADADDGAAAVVRGDGALVNKGLRAWHDQPSSR